MVHKNFIYPAVVLIFCVFKLYAQDTISYDVILNEALKKNLAVKNELLNIELAKGERLKTNNFFPKYPDVDLEYETDKFNNNKGNNLFGITLSQEIEIAGQFSLRNDVSNYRVRKAEFEYKSKTYEIGYNIKSILNNIITLQLILQLTSEIYQINEDLLYSSERRLKAGDISELEYNLVLIETNNSKASLNSLESEFKNAVNSLNVYLDYNKGKVLYINADTSYSPIILTLEQLKKTALGNRSDIKSKEYEKLANSSEISLYKIENIPSLKLSIGYTNGTRVILGDDIIGLHNITKIQDVDKNMKFGIGFSLPLPINGLFNYNQGNVQVAEIRTKIINNEIELLQREITADVINAYNKWESSKKNMELFQGNNIIILNTLELLKRGYDKGEINLINYLTEKEKLFDMRLNYIETFGEYNQSIIELEKVTQTKLY